jgi:sugar phosphate isomerase/epimerase
MKLSVSSYSFNNYLTKTKCSYLTILDIAKEMGFQGIEFIDLYNEKWGKTRDEFEMAREIREHAKDLGLEIVAYTVSSSKFLEDPKKELERLKGRVDIASELGVKLMRHDVTFDLKKEPLYTYREVIEELYPYIDELSKYAESKGIKTCTENHGWEFQSSHIVEAVIKKVNNPNFGWLVDLGNFLCVDEDPTLAIKTARNYAFHVHVKDYLFKSGEGLKPTGSWMETSGGNYIRGTILGNGIVPIKSCLSSLKNAGYDGYLTIEYEGMEDNIIGLKHSLNYMQKVLEII